jgi:peptidoglycan hydrolase-like protein with peptidoglycan-binding domain
MFDQIEALKGLQLATARLGYDPGPIDGLFGDRTAGALSSIIAARGQMRVPPVAAPSPGASMLYQGSARYPVREIIVHCSATRPDWMATESFGARVAEIRRWRVRDNGWRDIGYHWLIDRDGAWAPGRAETVIGAGVEGHNRGVIHICLLGGFGASANDRFERHFSTDQDISLRDLTQRIGRCTAIATTTGHNDHAAKACPGFRVGDWLAAA